MALELGAFKDPVTYPHEQASKKVNMDIDFVTQHTVYLNYAVDPTPHFWVKSDRN